MIILPLLHSGAVRFGKNKENFDVNTYRIVNNDDIVARVPPRHVGERKFIDGEGTIRDHVIEEEHPVKKRPDETYGQKNTNPPKKNSFAGFVPVAVRDHVPLLYAVHLWNSIIENEN
jgi:hypothetical protein